MLSSCAFLPVNSGAAKGPDPVASAARPALDAVPATSQGRQSELDHPGADEQRLALRPCEACSHGGASFCPVRHEVGGGLQFNDFGAQRGSWAICSFSVRGVDLRDSDIVLFYGRSRILCEL